MVFCEFSGRRKCVLSQELNYISWRTMACFVDDLITFSDSYLQHLSDLDKVLRILEDLGLTLKAKKTFLGFFNCWRLQEGSVSTGVGA